MENILRNELLTILFYVLRVKEFDFHDLMDTGNYSACSMLPAVQLTPSKGAVETRGSTDTLTFDEGGAIRCAALYLVGGGSISG